MGIDHIDLYWAHRDDESVEQADTVKAFGELAAAGTVGRLGQSNTALWRTERARWLAAGMGVAGPTAVQLRYSYLQPRPMVPLAEAFGHPGTTPRLAAMTEVACEVGCTRSEVELAWLAGGTPGVRPIIGVSRIEQLDAALRGTRLELGELCQRLDAAW